MKLTLRELILAWLTGVVLLFLPTWFFFISPRLADTQEKKEKREEAAADLDKEQRMLDQKDVWLAKMNEALKGLPAYPEAQDVTADMLIKVEQMAVSHNLVLTRREPQREKRHADMGSLDIKCNWEGSLDSLVHFLFALQQDHGMLDISQLYIKSENKGMLRGTFTINCSYVRVKKEGGTVAPAPSPGTVPTAEPATP
jgi:Tfp pilus assembly protein PilO